VRSWLYTLVRPVGSQFGRQANHDDPRMRSRRQVVRVGPWGPARWDDCLPPFLDVRPRPCDWVPDWVPRPPRHPTAANGKSAMDGCRTLVLAKGRSYASCTDTSGSPSAPAACGDFPVSATRESWSLLYSGSWRPGGRSSKSLRPTRTGSASKGRGGNHAQPPHARRWSPAPAVRRVYPADLFERTKLEAPQLAAGAATARSHASGSLRIGRMKRSEHEPHIGRDKVAELGTGVPVLTVSRTTYDASGGLWRPPS
jgi:hypothetical protein